MVIDPSQLKLVDIVDELRQLRAANSSIPELERTIAALRRELLLPCTVCTDGASDLWEQLADSLLLIEPIWVKYLQIHKETNIIDDIVRLKQDILRVEKVRESSLDADLSLFSLFPFSAGAFSAVAENERIKQRTRQLVSRESAVKRITSILMEMMRVLLEQLMELNSCGEKMDTIPQPSKLMNLKDPTSLEDFLYDEDAEEDATEVEL